MSPLTTTPPTEAQLRHQRQTAAEVRQPPVLPLGALRYGAAAAFAALPAADITGIPMAVLGASPAVLDAWHSDRPRLAQGRCGLVQWAHDGHWLFGRLQTALTPTEDLTAPSLAAYGDVFATLAETGLTHLARLWNYLPRINADGGGLERYRQFNAGRQQAFLDAGQAAFEGAPAACALGTRGGPLTVCFLAGRSAPLALENPRQVSAYRYPQAYGPRSPTFSRAALVDAGDNHVALLISGTASIVGHASQHPGDVGEQTRETLRNLQVLIEQACHRSSGRFSLAGLTPTVYLRHPEHLPAVQAVLVEALGGACWPDALVLEADICRSELLVEIEGHAIVPGAMTPA